MVQIDTDLFVCNLTAIQKWNLNTMPGQFFLTIMWQPETYLAQLANLHTIYIPRDGDS